MSPKPIKKLAGRVTSEGFWPNLPEDEEVTAVEVEEEGEEEEVDSAGGDGAAETQNPPSPKVAKKPAGKTVAAAAKSEKEVNKGKAVKTVAKGGASKKSTGSASAVAADGADGGATPGPSPDAPRRLGCSRCRFGKKGCATCAAIVLTTPCLFVYY